MVSLVRSAGLTGIEGYLVTVECFFSSGLPRLDIVGLPGKAVSEAAERVRAAIQCAGYEWPVARLTGLVHRTAVGHVRGRNVGVDPDAKPAQSFALPRACGQHPLTDDSLGLLCAFPTGSQRGL